MNRLCNNCTHDVFAFGEVHYTKMGYQRNMGSSVDVY